MMPERYIFMVLVAGAIGQRLYSDFSHWRSSAEDPIKRRLRRTPRYSADSFPDGVEGGLVGRVARDGIPLNAPLTGRECVAYRTRAERATRHRGWKVVAEASSVVPFVVADETGRALVRATRCDLRLDVDHEDMSDDVCCANSRAEAFLGERGQSSVGKIVRYQETVVAVGARVVVFGLGRHELEPDTRRAAGYRDTGRRLVIGDVGDDPVLVTDAGS